MREFIMNQNQKERVERNLNIVGLVVRTRFRATCKYDGFEYDELYQEGCMKLCELAVTYEDLPETDFQKISYTSIYNHLTRFVTQTLRKNSKHLSLDALNSDSDDSDDGVSFADSITDEEQSAIENKVIDKIVSETMIDDLLRTKDAIEKIKGNRNALGFKILLKMYQGYSGKQIASMYNITEGKVKTYIENARDLYRRYKYMESRRESTRDGETA